jgi:uncharacterized protein HemY
MARNLLGGKTFGEARWKDAVAFMEKGSRVEPQRIVHRLELASIYGDTGDRARAREQYETVLRLKPMDYNDKRYKEQARKELGALN